MKPRILVFTPTYLPGIKAGGPIRSIEGFVHYLNDLYDISLFTGDRDFGDSEPFLDIALDKWVKGEGCRIFYSSKISFLELRDIILNTEADFIYLNSFLNYQFSIKVILVLKLFGIKKKVVLAPRGEFSAGALKLKHMKKKVFIEVCRLLKLYNNITWHASSEYEKKDIKLIFPNSNVEIALNLSRIEKYTKVHTYNPGNALKFVFASRISKKKNLKFALDVISKLKNNVIFDIYGPIEDLEYWSECNDIINKVPSNVTINYKGLVDNQDMIKTLSRYDYFLFPTLGENFGHVIKESLLAGTPVIISRYTPWMECEERKSGYLIDIEDLIGTVEKLDKLVAIDEDEYKTMSNSCYEYVHCFLNLEKSIDNHKVIFQ